MRLAHAGWIGAALGILCLAGCNFAPHYARPTTSTSAAFKEAVVATPASDPANKSGAPHAGAAAAEPTGIGWKTAQPQDAAIQSHWWEVYQDPQLDDLEARVAISNQTVVAAAASYRAAYAMTQEAQAQLFPTLSLAPSATREKTSAALAGIGGGIPGGATTGAATTGGTTTAAGSGTGANSTTGSLSTAGGTRNLFAVPLEASYQIDLWGSVRNTVAENRFAAQASAAQLANAVLSTQSTLAQDYFQLRVADEQRRILEITVADYRSSLRLVRALVETGEDSEADVATAETQLESAMASATDVGVARAQYEHAIAVLIGVSPSEFSIPYRRLDQALPTIPVGVPSDLLERRPDIAAAERQVAESNAQIGVARAAYFPSLTLSASGGYESTAVSNLFKSPNLFWSAGPSLAQVLFDGGARRAASAQARAQSESETATYRQTVLAAIQSVEDNLAQLRILAVELGQAHRATLSAKRAVELTVVLFRNGVDSYVNVISAQNAFLSARETELQVQLRQLTTSVSLINDLGGGWSFGDLAQTERMARQPPRAGGPSIPPENSGPPVPSPPPLPLNEIQPDDLIKQNEATMGPAPGGSGTHEVP
jgi:NodT family efflux transporter outer membrane factor (OMF) lipoprotein